MYDRLLFECFLASCVRFVIPSFCLTGGIYKSRFPLFFSLFVLHLRVEQRKKRKGFIGLFIIIIFRVCVKPVRWRSGNLKTRRAGNPLSLTDSYALI